MPLTALPTALPEVLILEPQVFSDERGFFFESFNAKEFREITGVDRSFVQDNHSRSKHGVLRGIHYQVVRPQGKLVRVVQGEVFDVAVDLRERSPNLGRWVGVTLSSENRRQLWIPEGFGHAFVTVSDVADVLYKTTECWYTEHDRSVRWDDPDLGIEWPFRTAPLLASRDAAALPFQGAELL